MKNAKKISLCIGNRAKAHRQGREREGKIDIKKLKDRSEVAEGLRLRGAGKGKKKRIDEDWVVERQ